MPVLYPLMSTHVLRGTRKTEAQLLIQLAHERISRRNLLSYNDSMKMYIITSLFIRLNLAPFLYRA